MVESSKKNDLAANVKANDTAAATWQDAHNSVQLGAAWVLIGLTSYTVLSLLARATLHSHAALQQLQREVPVYVYDRSLFVFGTAFLLDVLGLMFELRSSRLDMVLLPAFVKGTATVTNVLMRCGWAAVGLHANGDVVVVQRFLCWVHTTPTILVLVKMMAPGTTWQQAFHAIVCVELMLVSGLAASLTVGWWSVILGLLSHLAFLPLLQYLHRGLREAAAMLNAHAGRLTMDLVHVMTMATWLSFGLVWDLKALGLMDMCTAEAATLCCDFAAKVLFSAGLVLSGCKGLDSRRNEVMRQIQESHKQALILELQRAIEQKDVFMSSVSHELRTPLNGIIGISEGLLANCCGVLSEAVRKQLFIVRTSGARLLALINDVMDAATLRQHRLVLKQERFELRQVVGDVMDLTRSLVDADVSLRNDVPDGLEVWADSGRIIQILNNLLGNAAKFTHRGSIRVSARWHDEQRQWLCVQVVDTGIGIPKQKLKSIFLPFEQVDGSICRQYGGFGLGLCVTQELVKAHGGELWVKSRERKGSVFAFTLPSYTGQVPPTPQQQLQLRQHSRRSLTRSKTPSKLMSSDAEETGLQQASRSSRGILSSPQSPCPAAAASAVVHESSSTMLPPSASNNTADARVHISHLPLLSSNSNNAAATPAGHIPGRPTSDLLYDCLEDYAKELPYDAAQLAALASSKPYISNTSSSGSSSLQRVHSRIMQRTHSMLRMEGAALEDGALVPGKDERPSQFACTGRYQILSVDDDPINQTVVQSLLASTGYEVVCLYSGQQTLEYFQSTEVLPDLVLLDMLMPDMSGPEVLQKLMQRQPPLSVPVIMVSALAEESSVVQGLDSGADDYITKPFRRAEFLARVRGKLQLANASGTSAEQVTTATSPSDAEQPVVMCITDDEVNHIVLEGIVQSQSYRYLKVSCGAEALQILAAAEAKPPHVVLLDAALPDTTGLDVLKALRMQYSHLALPVVMLTARHNEKAIVQALDAGANDYAVKPFRRSELLARIRMHLRRIQRAARAMPPAADLPNDFEAFKNEDLSVENLPEALRQQSWHLESLPSVPLLSVELGGLEDVLGRATAEQACQLLGFIADCFGAIVEKYAVLKVKVSDTSLTVAAITGISSANSSARNSMQLPTLQASTPGSWHSNMLGAHGVEDAAGSSAPLHDVEPRSAAAVAASPSTSQALPPQATSTPQASRALEAAVLQLLQMAQELQAHLGCSVRPGESEASMATRAPSAAPAPGTAGGSVWRESPQQSVLHMPPGAVQVQDPVHASTSLRMQPHKPEWWHGQLCVHSGIHVGALTGGVVGTKRPRYRLMGPALDVVKQASAAAPANSVAVTTEAAGLLRAMGIQNLQHLHSPENSGQDACNSRQLRVLRIGSAHCPSPAAGEMTGFRAATWHAGTSTGGIQRKGEVAAAAAALTIPASSAIAAAVDHQGVKPGLQFHNTMTLTTTAVQPPSAALQRAKLSSGSTSSTQHHGARLEKETIMQQQGINMAATVGDVPAAMAAFDATSHVLDATMQQSQKLLLQEVNMLAQQLSTSSPCASASLPAVPSSLMSRLQDSSRLPTALPAWTGPGMCEQPVLHNAPVTVHSQTQPNIAAAPLTRLGTMLQPPADQQDWGRGSLGSSSAQLSVASSTACHMVTPLAVQQAGLPLHLGSAELQQIGMLQMELAALQQQLTLTLASSSLTHQVSTSTAVTGCQSLTACPYDQQPPLFDMQRQLRRQGPDDSQQTDPVAAPQQAAVQALQLRNNPETEAAPSARADVADAR